MSRKDYPGRGRLTQTEYSAVQIKLTTLFGRISAHVSDGMKSEQPTTKTLNEMYDVTCALVALGKSDYKMLKKLAKISKEPERLDFNLHDLPNKEMFLEANGNINMVTQNILSALFPSKKTALQFAVAGAGVRLSTAPGRNKGLAKKLVRAHHQASMFVLAAKVLQSDIEERLALN